VLAQAGRGVLDLAVDGQVDQVLQLGALEPAADEAQLQRGLLDALGEVTLVEREAQVSVLQDVVLAGVSKARIASGASSGASKKRRLTQRSFSSPQSNARSTWKAQRRSGTPASLTAP
jgi:hypothetical protein